MTGPAIDHLVVGAADLFRGRQAVEALLGVDLSPGGKHRRMGTHNCLLKIGPATYLEVIAIDPDQPTPDRPRWFGLDSTTIREALQEGPRLLTWVVHGVNDTLLSPDLRARLGPWESMRREDLEWRITLPANGRLPAGGALPALIDWTAAGGVHPADRLPERHCRLQRLHLHHPEAPAIARAFTALGVTHLRAHPPATGAPALRAKIMTPRGPCTLAGPETLESSGKPQPPTRPHSQLT